MTLYNPRIDAFRVSPRAIGFDHQRSQYRDAYGTYVADVNATFRAGQLVKLNSEQRVVVCNGADPLGFSKYNKANTLYAAVTGERIQLNGTDPTNLLHSNLFVPGATGGVRVGLTLDGTPYIEGTDYDVNYTNGQIQRIALGGIADHAYVLVNYSYQLSEAELQMEGRNFWNQINDVDIQNGRVTVVNGKSIIFTTMYNPSLTYAVNDSLTAGTTADSLDGMVTKGGTGAFIGKVFQIPTATDPFLGITYVGSVLA